MPHNSRIALAVVLVSAVAFGAAVAYSVGFKSGVLTGYRMGRDGVEREAVRNGVARWSGQFPPHELEWTNVHRRWVGSDAGAAQDRDSAQRDGSPDDSRRTQD